MKVVKTDLDEKHLRMVMSKEQEEYVKQELQQSRSTNARSDAASQSTKGDLAVVDALQRLKVYSRKKEYADPIFSNEVKGMEPRRVIRC